MPREVPGASIFQIVFASYRITSRNRRLLYEGQAPKSAIDQAQGRGVSTELTPDGGIFQDSRNDTVVNHSARLAMAEHWGKILNGAVWLNYQYFSGNTPEAIRVDQASDLVRLATGLPAFLVFRADRSLKPDKQIPDEVADIAKGAFGLSILVRELKKPEFVGQVPEPEDLYRICDERGLLVRNGQGCAAPDRMMIPFFRALWFGTGGNREDTILLSYGIDQGKLLKFGRAYATASNRIRDFSEQVNESAGLITLSYDPWEVFLFEMRPLQRVMNEALGRNPHTAPPMTLERFGAANRLTR